MSCRDMDDAAYRETLRHVVLVDVVEGDAPGEELFGVIFHGECRTKYDDPIAACEHAEKLARSEGLKWDVTIHARNAADMS
jgi:hypothetical protein